jgi:hypothetical protein
VMIDTSRDAINEWQGIFRKCYENGEALQFFLRNRICSAKIEDPGLDNLCQELYDTIDEVKFLATYRPLYKVINSHLNIRPWGMDKAKVYKNYKNAIDFYETAASEGRLFMLPVEDKEQFSLTAMTEYLGVHVTEEAQRIYTDWPIINALKTQKTVSGDSSPIIHGYNKEKIQEYYPDVGDLESRYFNLVLKTNSTKN